jgi:hypothetical protein
LKTEVTYLGHVINKNGVKSDPKKLEAVKLFPQSKNIKQFLGMTRYYRRFIQNFSKLTKPLTNLQTINKNDTRFEWASAQEESFQTLKQLLCEEPVSYSIQIFQNYLY